MKKTYYKKLKIHDPELCKVCAYGSCCREGVEVDLFEMARILETSLNIPKPWFEFLRRDKRFPSGYKFATIVRDRRCVFQDKNRRCRVYAIRPRFCAEFPLEDGRRAPEYLRLCHRAKKRGKRAVKAL